MIILISWFSFVVVVVPKTCCTQIWNFTLQTYGSIKIALEPFPEIQRKTTSICEKGLIGVLRALSFTAPRRGTYWSVQGDWVSPAGCCCSHLLHQRQKQSCCRCSWPKSLRGLCALWALGCSQAWMTGPTDKQSHKHIRRETWWKKILENVSSAASPESN